MKLIVPLYTLYTIQINVLIQRGQDLQLNGTLFLSTFIFFYHDLIISKFQTHNHSFYHSIGMCRMRRFLAVLRSFFHSSPLYNFSCYSSPPTIILSYLTLSYHLFLGLPPSLVFFKLTDIILFWEFYFLPFSVHVQTNVIYVALLSLL
jgi:hypothetical protein